MPAQARRSRCVFTARLKIYDPTKKLPADAGESSSPGCIDLMNFSNLHGSYSLFTELLFLMLDLLAL